jgi:site-specific DNA recombinase
MNRRYLAYVRRSSDRDDKQTLSLDAQTRELKTYAEKHSLEIVDFLEESKSAYTPNNRPAFDEMLKRIEGGEADAVLVWHVSRLSRNSLDGGRLIWLMDEGRLKEIHTPTNVYQNSGDNKFILAIEFGMSKKSSDDTSAYVTRDARSKLLKGEWSGMAPIGYLNIDAGGKIAGKFYDHQKQSMLITLNRPLNRIEKDPVIGPILRGFFEWYLASPRTLRQSAHYINEMGVKSARLKGKFSISMVERILKNPFYMSQMRYEGELFPGVHEPFLSSKEFSDIQAHLSGKSHPVSVKQEFVYRGLMECGECGCAIVGVRKQKLSGKEYEYYGCSKRRGVCSQSPLKPLDIDRQVHERLRAVHIDKRVWELCKKLLKLHFSQQVEHQAATSEHYAREVSSIDRKLANLLDGHISEVISGDDYIAKKNSLLRERGHLEDKLREGGTSVRHWLLDAEQFFDKAHHAYTRFTDPGVTIEEKKHILRDIGWNLRLNNGILEWHYKKPFDILASQILEFKTVGTLKFSEDKMKNTSLEREVPFWRVGRDSNPQLLP